MAVPAKREKKPAGSIRYLLSADRRLRKLSLRKMADRVAKPKSRRKSTPTKNAEESPSSGAPPLSVSSREAILVVVSVLGVAALLTAGSFSTPAQTHVSRADVHLPPEATPRSNVALREASKNAAPKVSVAKQSSSPASPSVTNAAVLRTTAAAPPKPVAVKAVPKPSAAKPADTDTGDSRIVTITGCVDRNGDMFQLKDPSGAPRTRSWRSAFLKRRPAPVELVQASSALRLSDHVGKRVAATGGLVDREMRVQSLAIVSSACN
jgi:hypothetical protein